MFIRSHGVLYLVEAPILLEDVFFDEDNYEYVVVDKSGEPVSSKFTDREGAAEYIEMSKEEGGLGSSLDDDDYAIKIITKADEGDEDKSKKSISGLPDQITVDGKEYDLAGNADEQGNIFDEEILAAIQKFRADNEKYRTATGKEKTHVGEVSDSNPEGYRNDPDFPDYRHLKNVKLPLALDRIGRQPWTIAEIVEALGGLKFKGGEASGVKGPISKIVRRQRSMDLGDAFQEATFAIMQALKTDKGIQPFSGHVFNAMSRRADRRAYKQGRSQVDTRTARTKGQKVGDVIQSMDAPVGDDEGSMHDIQGHVDAFMAKKICPQCGSKETYETKEGDTLKSIARDVFGDESLWKMIARQNRKSLKDAGIADLRRADDKAINPGVELKLSGGGVVEMEYGGRKFLVGCDMCGGVAKQLGKGGRAGKGTIAVKDERSPEKPKPPKPETQMATRDEKALRASLIKGFFDKASSQDFMGQSYLTPGQETALRLYFGLKAPADHPAADQINAQIEQYKEYIKRPRVKHGPTAIGKIMGKTGIKVNKDIKSAIKKFRHVSEKDPELSKKYKDVRGNTGRAFKIMPAKDDDGKTIQGKYEVQQWQKEITKAGQTSSGEKFEWRRAEDHPEGYFDSVKQASVFIEKQKQELPASKK